MYTLHIVYSVIQLFGCSFIRLFGSSFMRNKLFVYSCSFIRLFVFVYSVVRVNCLLRSGFDCMFVDIFTLLPNVLNKYLVWPI